MTRRGTRPRVFIAVALLFLNAGWDANHFASMSGTLREQEKLSGVPVNAVFGIYALGLLPSLLDGGALADRTEGPQGGPDRWGDRRPRESQSSALTPRR